MINNNEDLTNDDDNLNMDKHVKGIQAKPEEDLRNRADIASAFVNSLFGDHDDKKSPSQGICDQSKVDTFIPIDEINS